MNHHTITAIKRASQADQMRNEAFRGGLAALKAGADFTSVVCRLRLAYWKAYRDYERDPRLEGTS